MVYTLVLRSENRTNSEDKTNKCRIRHGIDRAVADNGNWRVTVKQFLIPKSVDSNSDSTIYGYYHPPLRLGGVGLVRPGRGGRSRWEAGGQEPEEFGPKSKVQSPGFLFFSTTPSSAIKSKT